MRLFIHSFKTTAGDYEQPREDSYSPATCQTPAQNNPQGILKKAVADNRNTYTVLHKLSGAAFFYGRQKEETAMKSQSQKTDRIIRLRTVMDKTGLSKSTIYRLSGNPDSEFPQAVKLTQFSRGWYESEIDTWIASRKEVAA